MTSRERELDRILGTSSRTDDLEVGGLAETADDLARSLDASPPSQVHERALFVEGVASRHRSIASSLLVPGIAVVGFMFVIALMGRGALPGESLYPVRNVLRSAGLATAPVEVLEARLEVAETFVEEAEDALDASPSRAEDLAAAALRKLGEVSALIGELDADDREDFAEDIAELEEEALIVIRVASDKDAMGNDSSGSGSAGSGNGDDSSGPGSGDGSGDDSSGPGSGSDDSGDDSSGSGSGSDDSSGSGSGSDDDNSGKG